MPPRDPTVITNETLQDGREQSRAAREHPVSSHPALPSSQFTPSSAVSLLCDLIELLNISVPQLLNLQSWDSLMKSRGCCGDLRPIQQMLDMAVST